ncbi:unnamed protein product, partial [Anisakis simplex]|uniref:Uncharacterized protein n=1 Tax=Anisakis simplex TaxID=6269 RepID=A0A0M3JNL6_ANISI
MNLPALSPVYLEFREKAHEDGAPNTAESTLQNDDSPKLNDAKCDSVDDKQPDSLSGAEYGGHFGADKGHFDADWGQFGADDDNDGHIEKFTNVTSRTESRKSVAAARVRRKKFPLGKTDSERSSQ